MEYAAAVSAALTLLEFLLPKIEDAVKRGEVSPEKQKELRDRYNQLRAQGDTAFSGPEWKVD
jgi:hypothetical protein